MDWITENANRIGVVALLLIAVYGRYRQWWVDGPTHATVIKNRDELRAIVDRASDEARVLSAARDAENRKLRDELAALRSTVTRRTTGGSSHVQPARPKRRSLHDQ